MESTRAMPASSTPASLVNGTSMRVLSLKLRTKISSCGLDARTSASAAASTFDRNVRMLPLLSISSPSETGMSRAGTARSAAACRSRTP